MSTQAFEHYITDLLAHEDIQALRETKAHWEDNRFSHCYAVGKLSFRLAQLLNGNLTVAARGGFLHDWYHGHRPDRKRFSFQYSDHHHYRISVEAASKYGEHPMIIHTIRTHFWPWGRVRPKTREAWIVWSADNIVWVFDHFHALTAFLRRGYRNFIYGEVRS